MLDQAVEVFRARGFQATSFCDRTVELSISRQSLCDRYGNKQTLLPASLNRYRERSLDPIGRLLVIPGPVRPVIAQLCQGDVAGFCSKGNPGCFMANSMVEMAPHDDAIRAMALSPARDLEGLFATRISLALRTGDLAKEKDSAMQAAVVSLGKSRAVELAPRGLRINTISPGPITTPIYGKFGFPAEAQQGFEDHMVSQSLFQRFGTAEEVAQLVRFLLSDDSSYIVGDDIVIDGGVRHT